MVKKSLLVVILFMLTPVVLANKLALQTSHLLDYIAADYSAAVLAGEVIDEAEYLEMQEFSQQVMANLNALALPAELQHTVLNHAQLLQQAVAAQHNIKEVAYFAKQIQLALVDYFQISQVPSSLPNLQQGEKLYQQHCASCHGISGEGNGPLAAALTPAPTNFLDRQHMDNLSLFAIYNTIGLGVSGTAMQAFENLLTEKQRWDLSFYVASLTAEDEHAMAAGNGNNPISLQQLSSQSSNELMGNLSEQQRPWIDYLKTHPQILFDQHNHNDYWQIVRQTLQESYLLSQQGDYQQAYNRAVNAYLDGFEPLEPAVAAISNKQKQAVEAAMLAYRSALKTTDKQTVIHTRYQEALAALDASEQLLTQHSVSPLGFFISAFFILLREGLEIILVIALLMAMIRKTEKTELLQTVHYGWMAAVLAGLATWYASHQLLTISGANRELTEAITALLAAAILLYVGLWLHRNTQAKQWQQYLKNKLMVATQSKKASFAVFALCFIAVYREMFETLLFYETLLSQADNHSYSMIIAGAITAACCLLLAIWLIMKLGMRLPLQKFFSISKLIILTLAISFLGHGLHALEEAGKFPEWPINIPNIALLGLYPNLLSLTVQFIVIVALVLLYKKNKQQLSL